MSGLFIQKRVRGYPEDKHTGVWPSRARVNTKFKHGSLPGSVTLKVKGQEARSPRASKLERLVILASSGLHTYSHERIHM